MAQIASAAIRSPILLYLENVRENSAAKFAKENSLGNVDNAKVDIAAREALAPFEQSGGENPYEVQQDLQEVMQDSVGIVRHESEMKSALEHLGKFWQACKARWYHG